jgi:hypothetical protein
MGRARDLANILSSSGSVALDSELGLSLITPTSVATTGGSGSISATGAVSFTSASAISLNGCFSAAYDNYKIIIENISSSSGVAGYLRLRALGSDDSSANYHFNFFFSNPTSATTQQSQSSQNALRFVDFTILGSYQIIEINDPFLSRATYATGYGFANWGTTNPHGEYFSGFHNVSTSYSGFTIIPGTGNITGTVRVYGYRN